MQRLTGVMFSALLTTALLGVGCTDATPASNANTGGTGGTGSTVKFEVGELVHVTAGSNATKADGTTAHPFATVAAAMAAIEANTEWTGTLVIHAGEYEILADVVLPLGVMLEVEAGTTFKMSSLKALHAQADVKMLGTAEAPITFTWLTEGQPWGSVTNFEPTSQANEFRYVIFEHGQNSNFADKLLRGALGLHTAKALISHCIFRNNTGDDGLTLIQSDSIVEYTQFLYNASDAIDQGFGHAEIRYSYAEGNKNDSWDLGDGSTAWVHHNVSYKSGDKCVSVGEGSGEALIEHNLCVGGEIGLAIKDESTPLVRYNTFYGNGVGVWVYPSASGYGTGKGVFTGNIVWNSTTADFDLSADAATVFSYSCSKTLTTPLGGTVTGVGMTSPGNGCDDPMFADPENPDPNLKDFHLKSVTGRWLRAAGEPGLNIALSTAAVPTWVTDAASSPCIDAGDPAADPATIVALEPAPNGSRVNLGCYAGTEEASKSP